MTKQTDIYTLYGSSSSEKKEPNTKKKKPSTRPRTRRKEPTAEDIYYEKRKKFIEEYQKRSEIKVSIKTLSEKVTKLEKESEFVKKGATGKSSGRKGTSSINMEDLAKEYKKMVKELSIELNISEEETRKMINEIRVKKSASSRKGNETKKKNGTNKKPIKKPESEKPEKTDSKPGYTFTPKPIKLTVTTDNENKNLRYVPPKLTVPSKPKPQAPKPTPMPVSKPKNNAKDLHYVQPTLTAPSRRINVDELVFVTPGTKMPSKPEVQTPEPVSPPSNSGNGPSSNVPTPEPTPTTPSEDTQEKKLKRRGCLRSLITGILVFGAVVASYFVGTHSKKAEGEHTGKDITIEKVEDGNAHVTETEEATPHMKDLLKDKTKEKTEAAPSSTTTNNVTIGEINGEKVVNITNNNNAPRKTTIVHTANGGRVEIGPNGTTVIPGRVNTDNTGTQNAQVQQSDDTEGHILGGNIEKTKQRWRGAVNKNGDVVEQEAYILRGDKGSASVRTISVNGNIERLSTNVNLTSRARRGGR